MASRMYHSCETLRIREIAQQASINEDQEQRRRMLDKNGEKQKMWVGNKTAQLFKFTPYQLRHVHYPLQAPLFTRTKHATGLVEESVHTLEDAFHKVTQLAEDAYSKTTETIAAFTHKATDMASSAVEKTSEAASIVGEKTVEAANVVGDKTIETYHRLEIQTADARLKAKDTAVLIKHKTYEAASLFGHKTADIASVVGPLAADIAHDAKNRIVQLSDEIMYSTTKTYVKALMEFERRRRMTDFDEQYAILNALAASSCIKGLGYEFYRQTNVNFTYSFILLEELERKWRLMPNNSAIAFANAKKASLLVKGKSVPLLKRTTQAKTAPVFTKIAPPPVPTTEAKAFTPAF